MPISTFTVVTFGRRFGQRTAAAKLLHPPLFPHSLCKSLNPGPLSALLTHRPVAGLQMALPAGQPSHMASCMCVCVRVCYVCVSLCVISWNYCSQLAVTYLAGMTKSHIHCPNQSHGGKPVRPIQNHWLFLRQWNVVLSISPLYLSSSLYQQHWPSVWMLYMVPLWNAFTSILLCFWMQNAYEHPRPPPSSQDNSFFHATFASSLTQPNILYRRVIHIYTLMCYSD